MKRKAIRKQLLFLFVPLLGCVAIASTILSFYLVQNFSEEYFDWDLINSADSVVGRLRVQGEKVMLDLPASAQAILKKDGSDKFYFSVIDQTRGVIAGDKNLPPPVRELEEDNPRIRTGTIAGETVRIVDVKVPLISESFSAAKKNVIVQVAETMNSRRQFQKKILLSIAVPQLIAMILGLSAVWYGVVKILNPLRDLQGQLAKRSQADLSPLAAESAPEEVYPLVKAINSLFERSSEELKAQQRFLASAAHQLRTPLAGLKTYSSIGNEMTEASELKHIVVELDQGIDRASRMVNQLLALARTDVGERNKIASAAQLDLNFLVSDVVSELVDQAIRRGLKLTYEGADSPALITGEQTGLRHLVSNLIENAIFYTPNGGSITVGVKSGDKVILSVADTGPGIPVSEQEKVFERFYRILGTNGNGSGLGLAIVKEVANAHNAQVSIKSGTNEMLGTEISVVF
ncbi:MAG: sensor histidine kinase N-terminal domain-containing protein [Candidatus Melainabacteria bacterium]|nr:sensor histidine kinase N-terminal domain-containing protein [Candidatus Melainabacteria bacterium]